MKSDNVAEKATLPRNFSKMSYESDKNARSCGSPGKVKLWKNICSTVKVNRRQKMSCGLVDVKNAKAMGCGAVN